MKESRLLMKTAFSYANECSIYVIYLQIFEVFLRQSSMMIDIAKLAAQGINAGKHAFPRACLLIYRIIAIP